MDVRVVGVTPTLDFFINVLREEAAQRGVVAVSDRLRCANVQTCAMNSCDVLSRMVPVPFVQFLAKPRKEMAPRSDLICWFQVGINLKTSVSALVSTGSIGTVRS